MNLVCKWFILVQAVLRVYCHFRIAPENAAVIRNEMAGHTFHCTLNYSKAELDDILHNPAVPEGGIILLSWSKTRPEQSGGQEQYTFGELYPKYQEEGYSLHYKDGEGGVQYDFTVPLKNLDYSGNYSCNFVLLPKGQLRQFAWLVILESDPVCSMNPAGRMMEGDVVTFMCQVRYKGHPYPQMQWTGDDINTYNDDESVPGEIKKSSITITLNARHHAKSVTARTFFSKPKESENKDPYQRTHWATNAPVYDYTHKFPSMNVFYGPRNVIISPAADVYTLHQVLTCSADANPPVDNYIWTDNTPSHLKPNILKQGPDASSITLISDLLDRDSVTFLCTVRNSLNNQGTKTAFVEHTFRVLETTTTTATTTKSTESGGDDNVESGGDDNVESGGGGSVESGGYDNVESGGGYGGGGIGGGGGQAEVTIYFEDEKIPEALKSRRLSMGATAGIALGGMAVISVLIAVVSVLKAMRGTTHLDEVKAVE